MQVGVQPAVGSNKADIAVISLASYQQMYDQPNCGDPPEQDVRTFKATDVPK